MQLVFVEEIVMQMLIWMVFVMMRMNVLVFTTNVVFVMVQALFTNVDVLIFQKEIVIVLETKKMY